MQHNRPPQKFLLLVYLIAMVAIFGTSVIFFYILFARNLNRQFDEQLLTLAQVAVPSLNTVKNRSDRSLEKNVFGEKFLSSQQKTLEWFDADRQRLASKGKTFPFVSLFSNVSTKNLYKDFPIFDRQAGIRSVTIAVYTEEPNTNSGSKILPIDGYIRASQSTQQLEKTLDRLRWQLALGTIAALFSIGLTSIYLARQIFAPIDRSWQLREQFTTNFSHHLRNLLTKITLSIELMLAHSERFQASDARKLEKIDTATKQMQRLVDDLLYLIWTDTLTIAKTERNSSQWKRSRSIISLEEFLNNLVNNFQSIAIAKNITLETDFTNDISVRGDSAQLKRLFFNLLENALKYTHSEGIVTVSLERSSKFAVITIRDTGVGIAADDLPYIFQWFWHGEPTQETHAEGFGLGLAIAQAIIKQHRGKILVTSQIGIGSCFQVYLPLKTRSS
jgi:OmpR-family two-component system manganese-sensing sensor histidine kinase